MVSSGKADRLLMLESTEECVDEPVVFLFFGRPGTCSAEVELELEGELFDSELSSPEELDEWDTDEWDAVGETSSEGFPVWEATLDEVLEWTLVDVVRATVDVLELFVGATNVVGGIDEELVLLAL